LRIRIGHDRARAISELPVRAADARRDAHPGVFAPRPAVEHHDVLAAGQHRGELGDAHPGRRIDVLHQLTEGLARQVHALVDGIAGPGPRSRPAREHEQVAIAERAQPLARGLRQTVVAIVVHHHPRPEAWNETPDLELETAVRYRGGEEQVALAELPRLA